MISVIIHARLIKKLALEDSGDYFGVVADVEGDRTIKIICKERTAKIMANLPDKATLSISGFLKLKAFINANGKPKIQYTVDVISVLKYPPMNIA